MIHVLERIKYKQKTFVIFISPLNLMLFVLAAIPNIEIFYR